MQHMLELLKQKDYKIMKNNYIISKMDKSNIAEVKSLENELNIDILSEKSCNSLIFCKKKLCREWCIVYLSVNVKIHI